MSMANGLKLVHPVGRAGLVNRGQRKPLAFMGGIYGEKVDADLGNALGEGAGARAGDKYLVPHTQTARLHLELRHS